MMMSYAKLKKIGGFVFTGCCIQYFVMFMVLDQQEISPKHRLIARHLTERDVRGPTYHVHKVDPMKVDLRERYESRRLLVKQARTRFTSRTEILNDYRVPSSDGAVSEEDTPTEIFTTDERFVPLRDNGDKMALRCDTCALVSSSGHMMYSGLGDQIDDAHCVFRLNAAPTLGHELDVGRKTTARVLSHRSMADLVANSSMLLQDNPSMRNLFVHGSDYQFTTGSVPGLIEKVAEQYPRLGVHRIGKVIRREAEEDFKKHTGKSRISSGSELSTGLYALKVMRDVCSNIKVYGMTPEDYCRGNADNLVPYSYYKNPSISECMVYDYHETTPMNGQRLSTERRIFKAWADQDTNIAFLNPTWD